MRLLKNSLPFWFNKIKIEFKDEIPMPETTFFYLDKDELVDLIDENVSSKTIEKARNEIDHHKYPFFIRTDLCSGKHRWDKSCYVKDKNEDIGSHLLEVALSNILADIFGLPFTFFVFREYIPLEHKFYAFSGNLPIAKERRYFIKNGEVQCHHPYWVKESIDNPSIPNWESKLEEINKEDQDEIEKLTDLSLKIASLFPDEYWSVDYAKGEDGVWYMIDMALGDDSFHDITCQYCPIEMKRHYETLNQMKKRKPSLTDLID